jgi:hypothetical protein
MILTPSPCQPLHLPATERLVEHHSRVPRQAGYKVVSKSDYSLLFQALVSHYYL